MKCQKPYTNLPLIGFFIIGVVISLSTSSGLIAQDRTSPGELLNEEYSPEERINIAVYEKVNRGVVYIATRSVRVDAFFMFEVPSEGSGSGSILDKNGHILTNYHVVNGAREIRVTLYDGKTYDAKMVGQDPVNDIAVLRIDAPQERLFPVQFGDSNRLKVGQKIYAIGNPFGLERTMTVGIISSLNRSLRTGNHRTMKSIIQLDAALNQGNSGGPLASSRGEIIGMNTAIASRTGQNTGVGFAIPSSTIRRVVPQLIKNGRVIRADIGITRVYQTEKGLLIASLVPGGPAERAGLRGFRVVRIRRSSGGFIYEETRVDRNFADLIVSIDGKKVTTFDGFMTMIESKKPGTEVVVSVMRENRQVNFTVVLGQDQ